MSLRESVALFIAIGICVFVTAGLGFWAGSKSQPAPSQPRETPWTWDAPDSNARCYFLEDQPIGCYQKGTP